MDVVKKIEQVGTGDGKPIHPVKIVDCGETSENKIQGAVGNAGIARHLFLLMRVFPLSYSYYCNPCGAFFNILQFMSNIYDFLPGKKKKAGKIPSSDDSSDGQTRGKQKKSLKDRRKKRKKRYLSSDSYSSDDDSDSGTDDDSESVSDSSLSDSSSSSDGRHIRKRKSLKRGKHQHGRKRRDGRRERKRVRHNRRSKRKSKWSSLYLVQPLYV